jgi:hypothetical protein
MIFTKSKLIHFFLFSFVCVASARVFTSIKYADTSFQMLSDFGGASVYSAAVNINNSQANLQIFSFDSTLRDTLNSLKNRFGIDFSGGGSFAKGQTNGDKFVTRFIVLNFGNSENTLVFAIRQNKYEYKKSKLPLTEHLLMNVPAYPGSDPVSFLGNDDTSFSMETSEVYASPVAVQTYYVNTMEALGWTTGVPLKAGQKLPNYMTWIKAKKFCSVYANANPTGKTTVSIIYKELGK